MPGLQDGWGFKSACGLFTCLLLAACAPEPGVEEAQLVGLDPPGLQPPVTTPEGTPAPAPAPEGGLPSPEPTGATWFVSTQGKDTAPGTSAAPVRTVRRAVALAQPGDLIRVRSGVYAEDFVFDDRGATAAAITVRGEGSPLPTLVPGGGSTTVVRVQGRWRLEDLRVDVGGAPMLAVLFEKSSRGAVLAGSELRSGAAGAGVLVEGAQDVLLRDNHIHHFIREGRDSHGVLVVGPSRGVTVRGNDIHHNSGDSIQCQAGSAPAQVLLIEDNTLHDEGENGVDIKRCLDVTVRGNVMRGFPNTAIRALGSSAGEAVVIHESAQRVLVQDNILSRAGRGVSILADAAPPEDIRVENNLFQEIRDLPEGNGQGVRVAGARNVTVVGNTFERTASWAMMLAADGVEVPGLEVRDNTLPGSSTSLLVRLGEARYRPGMVLRDNRYARQGILKADHVTDALTGANARFLPDFPGDRLTLSSDAKLQVWRQVLGLDSGTTLLE
ncbi:right-handed parallel beta-helix repeat-containing protein [Melittangium boletus]|uniref:right-handed parallel beta-helix repeat-containing protein n=1 Tax=Melittangium boletus TaxID=83453 RepID=UPI003DA3C0D2